MKEEDKKRRDNNTTFGVFVQFEESALNCTFQDKIEY